MTTSTTFEPKTLDDIYAADAPPMDAPSSVATAADAKPGDEPAPQPAPAAADKPADKAAEGAPPAPEGEKPESKTVPLKAFEDERRKRQKMEQDLRELRGRLEGTDKAKKAATPDPLLDPEAFAQHIRDQEFSERVADSRADMIEEVGEDEFQAKEAAFMAAAQADKDLAQRLRRSRDPAKFAYREGKKLLDAAPKPDQGDDALFERFKSRLAADFDLVPKAKQAAAQGEPAAQPAPSQTKRVPSVPTSLAGVQSAGARSQGAGAPVRKTMDDLYQ